MKLIILPQRKCCGGETTYHVILQKEVGDDPPNPLSEDGFIQFEQGLIAHLREAAAGQMEEPEQDLLTAVDQTKGLGRLFARFSLTRKVARIWREFSHAITDVAPQIGVDAQQAIYIATTEQMQEQLPAVDEKKKPKVKKALSWLKPLRKADDEPKILPGMDAHEVDALRRHNALYMGRFFSEAQAQRSKEYILDAYVNHRGEADQDVKAQKIADELKQRFTGQVKVSDAYWNTFATNALNNARTYSSLRVFQANGIVAYRIRNVLDSHTSTICRALANRVFPVAEALASYERMFQATSLAELERISPMIRDGKAGDYQFGRKGNVQSFGPGASPRYLIEQGIFCPPFHFHCRSWLEAVMGVVDAADWALDDFEDLAMEAEYIYYRDKLNLISTELAVVGRETKDLIARAQQLNDLADEFRLLAKQFDDVLNYQAQMQKFEFHFDKLLKRTGSIAESSNDTRARILEIQTAFWARANKHTALVFAWEIMSNIEVNSKGVPVGSDIDLLTLSYKSGQGWTLNNFQLKFAQNVKSKSLDSLKETQVPHHYRLMSEPNILLYGSVQARMKLTRQQQWIYTAIYAYFDGKLPENITIYGATSPVGSLKNDLEADIIKNTALPNIRVIMLRNIDNLNTDTWEL